MRKILFTILFGLSAPAFGLCPPRPGDAGLTFSQVMYHFGRGLRIAGTMAMKGMSDPASVTPPMMLEARDALAVAHECAELSRKDTTGDLQPRKVRDLTGELREQYLARFHMHMQAFATGLSDFHGLICGALLEPVDFTRFQAMKQAERELLEMATAAHEDLQ